MGCNDFVSLIDRSDFDCIAQLATHCDQKKLCIAIQEAQNFDMANLLCDFWYDVIANKDNDEYQLLLCGGNYKDCHDRDRYFLGLKRTLVYYAYSRYLLINEFNDTPTGSVVKISDFSASKSLKEINLFADKYRSNAFESWRQTEQYLCVNKDTFKNFNSKNCKECGCENDSCNGKTTNSGYGIRIKKITKKNNYDLY